MDFEFHFTVKEKCIVHPHHFVGVLAGIAKTLCELNQQAVPEQVLALLKHHQISSSEKAIAAELHAREKSVIILGAWVMNHPFASLLRAMAKVISEKSNSRIGIFTEGGNAAGAWLAGAIPHRGPAGISVSSSGKTAYQMLSTPLKAYVLCNIDPELDCANPSLALKTLDQAACVIALSPYRSSVLEAVAHVMLPVTPFTETSGTFVNVEGTWQSFSPVIPPWEESKPGWKVVRVLGNLFELEGFQHSSSEDVRNELKAHLEEHKKISSGGEYKFSPMVSELRTDQLTRLAEWPIYRGDVVVRRADALQKSATSEQVVIRIHSQLAKKLHLVNDEIVQVTQGDHTGEFPVVIDDRIHDGCVLLQAGFPETAHFGESFGSITLKKLHT